MSAHRAARGFTLLEVMISLAILAVALVALSSLNGGAVRMHAYSRGVSRATLLLRSKMLDLEDELQKSGFSDFSDEKSGDFESEDAPEYRWRARIIKPDIKLDSAQLLGLVGGADAKASKGTAEAAGGGLLGSALGAAGGLLGGAGAQGAGGAAAAGGPLGGLLQTQANTFIETLKKSVRELQITVTWKDGRGDTSIQASQIVVILPEMVNRDPGALGPSGGAGINKPPPGPPVTGGK